MSADGRPILVAVTNDHHCGSTLGLCPPEGVRLDDGGNRYLPGLAQKWSWDCWTNFWQRAYERKRAEHADAWLVYNGDLFEGDHHHTSQIISRNPEPQKYIAKRVFGVPYELMRPRHTFIVRGTEAHVGPSGASEEAFAASIHAEQDPATGVWSHWHLRLEPNGVRLDFQHHGRAGARPWTEASNVSLLAANIFYEHARRGIPHPHVAFRAHVHRHSDSYGQHPTRAVVSPAWQLKTAHAHKVVPESIADVGGCLCVCYPDGTFDVETILYPVELPSVWLPPSQRSAPATS